MESFMNRLSPPLGQSYRLNGNSEGGYTVIGERCHM
jgi:hypothetical protein